MRTCYRAQAFPPHTHEYFTLGVVLSGVGTLGQRGAEHRLHPGDVVVIPPGEVHTGGTESTDEPLSYAALHLPASALTNCALALGHPNAVPDFASVVVRDADIARELRRLDAMVWAEPRGGADMTAVDDAIHAAIHALVSRHAVASRGRHAPLATAEPIVVKTVREIIDDCYADTEQTSLNALAARVGVTPAHLVRLFTETTGLSPHRYVVQTRIRRAEELLASGMSSSFVAAMTGFADQSHLTTQFKRYVGTTPAWYQRCRTLRPSAPDSDPPLPPSPPAPHWRRTPPPP
jgi:AraC-like DNA-binding protein